MGCQGVQRAARLGARQNTPIRIPLPHPPPATDTFHRNSGYVHFWLRLWDDFGFWKTCWGEAPSTFIHIKDLYFYVLRENEKRRGGRVRWELPYALIHLYNTTTNLCPSCLSPLRGSKYTLCCSRDHSYHPGVLQSPLGQGTELWLFCISRLHTSLQPLQGLGTGWFLSWQIPSSWPPSWTTPCFLQAPQVPVWIQCWMWPKLLTVVYT